MATLTQLHRARRTRRRSLLLSLLVQIGILAALILIPLLSKAPRIALANVMPLPPYYHATNSEPATERPHPATRPHEFTFCLICPPVLNTPHTRPLIRHSEDDNPSARRRLAKAPAQSAPNVSDLPPIPAPSRHSRSPHAQHRARHTPRPRHAHSSRRAHLPHATPSNRPRRPRRAPRHNRHRRHSSLPAIPRRRPYVLSICARCRSPVALQTDGSQWARRRSRHPHHRNLQTQSLTPANVMGNFFRSQLCRCFVGDFCDNA